MVSMLPVTPSKSLHSNDSTSERHRRTLRQKCTLPIIYINVFFYLFGENIQPAARTQIYEA